MRAEALPRHDAPQLRLEIDHLPVSVPQGTTVLRAAELAGIYVPSLCSHKELSPFGSCRLCAVEIVGMRGYPLACSTLAQDGMAVTTDTAALREMRKEVLQLILSEHPSSCLVCDEKTDCDRSMKTIHKAGVATGCHSCSNDGGCELQRVVEGIGVTGIAYPVAYRGLEPEHDDPFYDRDYNLCILCGRCVRMCHEVRGTSVLAFKYRGPKTLIGPAWGSSHIAAGCEFCGACVSVCPTGALVDKVSKWDGLPDDVETSTCPFCAIGCQLEVAQVEGRLSAAKAALDPEINDGQLCVRGRFCLPEATHHHSRARKPMLRRGKYFRVADWDEALEEVAERLAGVAPDDFLMLASGDLTNEGLYAAQRLVRRGLGSSGIDSTAGVYLPGGPALWSRLFSLPISVDALSEADAVVTAGLDSRFSFSVVGVQARRALRRGARLVTVDARESNLARMAEHWLQPHAGEEARALTWLLRSLSDPGGNSTAVGTARAQTAATTGTARAQTAAAAGKARTQTDPAAVAGERSGVRPSALTAAAQHLGGSGKLAVLIGPRVFDCPGADDLVAALEAVASRPGTTVVPLAHGTNVRGALELGVPAGVAPGPRPATGSGLTLADVRAGQRPKVLYLVGEAPFATRPDCDYLIAQDLYLPPFEVDAFLPAASFAESHGTLTNIEGRVQEQRGVEQRPAGAVHGFALPDWRIFSDLAERLGLPDPRYADTAAVRAAIHAELPDFPTEPDRAPRRMAPMAPPAKRRGSKKAATGPAPAAGGAADAAASAGVEPAAAHMAGKGRFVLVQEHASFRHRGSDLSGVVEGLNELHLEEGLRMNADDMARLGVEPDGMVAVAVAGLPGGDLLLPARPDPDCPRGAVYVSRVEAWGCLSGRAGLEPLTHLSAQPLRVRVTSGDRARTRGAAGDRTHAAKSAKAR